MVYVEGPEEWKEQEEEAEEEHDAAYYFGIILALIGFFVIGLCGILVLSWPLAALWNLAAGPFDIPELTQYEFAAGWVVMIILIRIVKNFTGN